MAYANQMSKTFSKAQVDEIISRCTYNPNITLDEVNELYKNEELFKGGNGVFWLYFIWFDKSSVVRKRFLKHYYEYLSLL